VRFKPRGTEAIFEGSSTADARRTLPARLHRLAQRKLALLGTADQLSDIAVPPGNRFKRLVGERKGQYSIRINDQYRICFRWDQRIGPYDVEIVDNH